MKKVLLIFCVLFSGMLLSQELGEFKPKSKTFGLKKLESQSKRIYIANFSVNYQVYNEKQLTKEGGALYHNRGVRGNATAELMVGLGNLTENDFKLATNQLYNNFIADLKSKDFTILTYKDVIQTETYKGWKMSTGDYVLPLNSSGIITAVPKDFTFFYKQRTAAGQFLNNSFSVLDKTPQNLSKELNNAIIVNVNLNVFFMKDLFAFQGNAANIKIKTQLSLVANETITTIDNSGNQTYVSGENTIQFVCGKYKIGGSAESVYTGSLKKDFTINNVLEQKVIQSFSKGQTDFIGKETVIGTFYSAENKRATNSTLINVNKQKYYNGIIKAAKTFLEFHVNEFNKAFK